VREEKELRWVSSSYRDLLAFPRDARRTAGFELGKVQAGLEPQDWKPLDVIGAGAREIRIRDVNGIFRVIYVAKFEEAVYVLHCFQKKTQATSTHDKAIAEARYRSVVNARKTSNESRR
jgi:phage-related protein